MQIKLNLLTAAIIAIILFLLAIFIYPIYKGFEPILSNKKITSDEELRFLKLPEKTLLLRFLLKM
jgi:hypothetical protein